MRELSCVVASLVCMHELMAIDGLSSGRCTECQNSMKSVRISTETRALVPMNPSTTDKSASVKGFDAPSNAFSFLALNLRWAVNARGGRVRLGTLTQANSQPMPLIPQLSTTLGKHNNYSQPNMQRPGVLKEKRNRGKGLGSFEAEKALSQSVQKQLLWLEKREEMAAQLGRSVSDEEFAAELGLQGGAAEYRHEMARMDADRTLFIQSNMPLVYWLAQKYNDGMELEDLIQEGMFGLIVAVERFDPARGLRFSTMAYYWVRQAITRATASKRSAIRVPVGMGASIKKMKKEIAEFFMENQRFATPAELAERMNVSIAKVGTIQRAASMYTSSLDVPIGGERDPGGKTVLSKVSDQSPQPIDIAEAEERREAIDWLLGEKLTSAESLLVRMRYGLEDGVARGPKEIAKELNIPQKQIVSVLAKAKRKLRREKSGFGRFSQDAQDGFGTTGARAKRR